LTLDGLPRTIHATCVAIDGVGVLIMGPSGAGKSDLALRLIDRGATLVSDDRCIVENDSDGTLAASPPAPLVGKIEVGGIGIVSMNFLPCITVALVVALESDPPRMPDEGDSIELRGHALPRLRIDARHASAPQKVALALRQMMRKMD
jgi:HPr kinase/phosphorylase